MNMSSHSTGTFGSAASGDYNGTSNRKKGSGKRSGKKKKTATKNTSSFDDSFQNFDSRHSTGGASISSNSSEHERRQKDRSGKRSENNRNQGKYRPGQNNNGSGNGNSNGNGNNYNNSKKEGKPLKHNNNSRYQQNEFDEGDVDEEFETAPNSDTEVKSVVSKNFDDVYQRGRRLGLGAFAVVFIGSHRPTGAEYAVKQIDRSTMFWGDRDALQDEIVNLKMARAGPNIVQLYEVYEEKAFCYLIMEVMEGGELLECIIERKTTFTEKEARSAVRCVLRALAYLHSNRVAHRDIKPENLLLSDPYQKDLNSVKLADFSFARQIQKRNACRTLCGTPGYLSPEMLQQYPAYDVKCDVWSVGCLLFLLLGGFLPFDDEDDEVVFDLTRDGRYEFLPEFWNSVSQSAKDLITKMLTVNPKKRITASRALQSHWIEHGDEEFEERQLSVKNIKNLVEGKRKLKTAMKTVSTTKNRI